MKYTTKSTIKTKYGKSSNLKYIYEIGNTDSKNNADTTVNTLLSPVAPFTVIKRLLKTNQE